MSEEFGLYTMEKVPIPLTGVAVTGSILGRGTRVHVAQTYFNGEPKNIEAIFRFPLPEGAAVCGFRVRIGNRVIESSVEEREKAFELYDKALEAGDRGYLLDQERPNIFSLSVGNLPPSGEAIVEIEFVQLLEVEGNRIRFCLPTTIAPRYLPAQMPEKENIPERERIHPAYADEVPYGLSLALNVYRGDLIDSVESPSHPIRFEKDGDLTRVSLSSEHVSMDRDFLLYLGYRDELQNQVYKMQDKGKSYLQLDYRIRLPEELTQKKARSFRDEEIIFVLDCSGSMGGDSILEAKRALEICLRSMYGNVRFNICRFGTKFEFLFPEAVPYDEESFPLAIKWLKTVEADMGGTEVLAPLKLLFVKRPIIEGVRRNIILLTDGEVGNEAEVMALARDFNYFGRFFPIGIGSGPNEFFIRGLARAGKGIPEFIYPGERIEPKVIRLFHKLKAPEIENVKVDWGKGEWDIAGNSLTIYRGDIVTLFAQSQESPNRGYSVTITATVEGRTLTTSIPVIYTAGPGLPIPVLWAREKIRILEEGDGRIVGSNQDARKTAQREKSIINISKTYGLLSSLTSFVAVEKREVKNQQEEIVLRKVPALIPAGWHGRGSIRSSNIVGVCDDTAAPVFFDHKVSYQSVEGKMADSRMDVLYSILASQEPSGGLQFSEDIASSLGLDLNMLRKGAEQMTLTGPADRLLLLSTAVLFAALEQRYASEESLWRGTLEKSRQWLDGQIKTAKPNIAGVELSTWAQQFVMDTIIAGKTP